MSHKKPALTAAAVLLAAGCGSTEPDAGSGTAGFASYAGVLGCAEQVAWGTVAASRPVADGLEVALDVEEWVYPYSGSETVTFVADDPAQDVGAPAWEASSARLLVVISEGAPPSALDAEDGRRAVDEWRDADSPRTPREHCAKA